MTVRTFSIGDLVYDPQTMETGKVIALCEGSQDERLHEPPKGTPIVLADDPRKAGSGKCTPWPSAQPLQSSLVVVPGFKQRNIPVGQCDKLIALTFGVGCVPKDGGTKHCWDNSTAQERIHIPIGSL